MRTTACTDTNVHVNTHTQLHTTYSAVWPVSQRCVQSINQTASMPINTVSEANAQNTDRRDRMLFWGTEEGRRGGGGGISLSVSGISHPITTNRECDWMLWFWIITTRG